jgi:hypothetical protein
MGPYQALSTSGKHLANIICDYAGLTRLQCDSAPSKNCTMKAIRREGAAVRRNNVLSPSRCSISSKLISLIGFNQRAF